VHTAEHVIPVTSKVLWLLIGRNSTAHKKICDDATQQHANSAAREWDDSDHSGFRDANVMFSFEVIRHPGHIEPYCVVNAAKPEHQTPDSASTK
jgi:hypothetical protein